jgi:hypothetical protein
LLYFENYNEQDAHAHGEADTGRDWRKIPGAFNAATASEVIIGMYDRKRPFSEVETYLRERVYRFAPGAASSRPGGTAERFRKEPTPEVTIDFGVAP